MAQSTSRTVPNVLTRARRVLGGFADPATRPAYVHQLKRRGRKALGRPAPERRCRACGSAEVTRRRQTLRNDTAKRSFVVELCGHCGYVGNPDNFNDYRNYESVNQFPVSARVGTADQPGREFYMAQLGCDILAKPGIEILIVGPGASVDYQHIAALDGVARVAIGDIVKLHDVPDFVDLTKRTRQRFDLVLASEVVEHLTEPSKDLPNLFRLLRRDGIFICSTNVYDGGNLNRQEYLYIRGHTSYYSPRALRLLGEKSRMFVDFRLPAVAQRLGPRKRYVLFTRTARRAQDIAEYFGQRPYAPSEP